MDMVQGRFEFATVVKLATTEDTRLDASSNSRWASGQPFDTRMACLFGILSPSVILRNPFRWPTQMAETGWLPFTASPFEFRT